MHSNLRILARYALDNRFKDIKLQAFQPAPESWVRAIRESLNMTTRQFAKRLGVSQPRIIALEKAEERRTVTLESLERAARALECDFVYAFVPRKTLNKTIEDQALKAATQLTASTQHSMALEAQSTSKKDSREQIHRIATEMIRKADTTIWDVE